MKLSIISPVYKASGLINNLVRRIEDSVKIITLNYEIILVDNASSDRNPDDFLIFKIYFIVY